MRYLKRISVGSFNRRRRNRCLAAEQLAARQVMAGDLEGWDNAAALTLSFPPDGTRVGNDSNSLDATWQTLGTTAEWQAEIARAFQTWAQYANVNLGVVSDDGSPLGIRGLTHGDTRFGDVRVAGIPMSQDSWAAAVDEHRVFAGSWTGDTFFNTDRTWTSLDEVFAAALHEAGHVLGLPHSSDPQSPMYAHGLAPNLVPTAADIALLQELYGPRVPDEHEQGSDNNSLGHATAIEHAEMSDGYDGSIPVVEFADLHNTTDADYYLLPILTGYSGSLTFEARTAGLSLMQPRVTVYDRHGAVLGQATADPGVGGVARLSLAGPLSEKVYIRVDSPSGDLDAVGGYALVVHYDQRDTTPPDVLEHAVREGFRWRGLTDESLATINLAPLLRQDPDPHYDEDESTDDSASSGRSLDPVTDNTTRRKYQFVGTISTSGDVDNYIVSSPNFTAPSTRDLTVTVESLTLDGVIADVTLLDKQGHELPAQVLSNGAGLVMLHLPQVASDSDYIVQVRTTTAQTTSQVGNYSLVASYDTWTPDFQDLVTGSVTPDQPQADYTLYVARTQLFSFVLDSSLPAGAQAASVWATLIDDHQRPVFMAAGPAGESRSGPSVILTPGEYHLVVSGRLLDGVTPAAVDFTLRGRQTSDPVGPPVVDPNSAPQYACPSGPNPYCYPGGVTSTVPYLTTPSSQPAPTIADIPIVAPADNWFWTNSYLRSNPVNIVDVVPDGVVAPIDALLVINFLNANPSGVMPLPPAPLPYLDVNNDGIVAPIDVLLVINHLNLLAGGEGEGPAPVAISGVLAAGATGAIEVAAPSPTGPAPATLLDAQPAVGSPLVAGGGPLAAAVVSPLAANGPVSGIWLLLARRRR